MKRSFHFALFAFALVLGTLAGCSSPVAQSPAPTNSTESSQPSFPGLAPKIGDPAPRIADVRIELVRTECFGTCPVYTLQVNGDGSVVYEGHAYVVHRERIESRIDPALLEPILREMESIDFLRHEHTCQSLIMDTPETRITLDVAGTTRTQADNFVGEDCGPDEPGSDQGWHDAIDRIGRLVDEVTRSSRWVGTDKERRKSGPKSP